MSLVDPLEDLVVGADKLRRLTERAMKATESVLTEPREALIPTLAVLTRDGPGQKLRTEVYLLAVPFDEGEEKYPVLYQIGQRIYQAKRFPLAWVLTSEAWLASFSEGTSHCEPRHHPERQEVIIVQGTTLDSQHNTLATMPIRRLAGLIVPGEFGEIQTEGLEARLLLELARGFFAETIRRMGSRRADRG